MDRHPFKKSMDAHHSMDLIYDLSYVSGLSYGGVFIFFHCLCSFSLVYGSKLNRDLDHAGRLGPDSSKDSPLDDRN